MKYKKTGRDIVNCSKIQKIVDVDSKSATKPFSTRKNTFVTRNILKTYYIRRNPRFTQDNYVEHMGEFRQIKFKEIKSVQHFNAT